MAMRRTNLIKLILLGSSFLLLAAFGFQYLLGMQPCVLCIWQRWPHGVAIVIALSALRLPAWAFPWLIMPYLGAMASATSAGIAIYHTGVERHWWLSSCASRASTAGLSAEDLLAQITSAPTVLCDVVAWEFVTLSMASWNGIASVLLTLIWLASAKKEGGLRDAR